MWYNIRNFGVVKTMKMYAHDIGFGHGSAASGYYRYYYYYCRQNDGGFMRLL